MLTKKNYKGKLKCIFLDALNVLIRLYLIYNTRGLKEDSDKLWINTKITQLSSKINLKPDPVLHSYKFKNFRAFFMTKCNETKFLYIHILHNIL